MQEPANILVVDDSSSLRTVLAEALADAGFSVRTAEDGYAAIKRLKEARYALVTLDIEMPGLGGIEVLRIAKRLDPECCVLMVTSLNTLSAALDAIRMGAYDYITKPFEVEAVLASVRRGLERRSLQLENQRLLAHLTEANQALEVKVRDRTAQLAAANRQLEEANAALRETNRELEKAYQELKELDRLKSEFITIASHELRTPLVAIQGYTNIILQGRLGDLNERQRSGLQIAETNIHRLVAIVNDILDIARIDAHKLSLRPRPFGVHELLLQLKQEMQVLVDNRNQRMTVEEAAEPFVALADRDRVLQVLSNLISNAIRFTPDHGELLLGCRRADEAGLLEVWVRDTGIGIERQFHRRIFEPFFEVQASEYHSSGSIEFRSGGTGLGLSIVKGIVEQHGGRVWVESEPGKGSTFRFTLPEAADPRKPGAERRGS
jgi:signal transduction histidine kinase